MSALFNSLDWDVMTVFKTWLYYFQWHPTPALLPGKSNGRRSLVGCTPWGRGGWDTTERLHFHFSLSCIGEGNGNPLQCSCLENPRDGGAWWAAVCGVTEGRTRLKWLSSSSSILLIGEVNGNPLQYSCLENPIDKRRLTGYSPRDHKSQTGLGD